LQFSLEQYDNFLKDIYMNCEQHRGHFTVTTANKTRITLSK